jgi:hypothetical protein
MLTLRPYDSKIPLDCVLWRYMDLSKFVSLLHTRALYFPALRMFDGDPFEGCPPKHVLEAARKPGAVLDINSRLHAYRAARRGVFVSCWHANKIESDAMWKLYGSTAATVAIRSTYQRMVNIFGLSLESYHGGMVQYVDFETYAEPAGGGVEWAMFKRENFVHECEFRILKVSYGSGAEPPGLSIPVDLDTLIEGVYVSPLAPPWTAEVVRDMIPRYALTKDVKQSTLLQMPAFFPEVGP